MRDDQPSRVSQLIRDYKVVVVGGGGVGKSCLTVRYVHGDFCQDYDPTIEDSYTKQVMIDYEPANISILDTAGQEEYISMREHYVRSGEAFLLVYSITDKLSFEEMQSFHKMIMRVKEKEPGDVPIVLVGNKFDLEWDREVGESDGLQLAGEFKCPFFETSAHLDVNVNSAFETLVREVRRINEELKENRYSQIAVKASAPRRKTFMGTSRSTNASTSRKTSSCIIG